MGWRVSILRLAVVAASTTLCLLQFAIPAEAQFRRNSQGQVLINPLLCYTDRQVRQAIAAQGFTNIFLNAPIEDVIRARATRGNTVYLIDFDRCGATGIIGVAPLRPAN
ncbi:MAG TPA: hypothetical protein VL418_10815 [Devosiaceae bacterium]|nr:hypothetical protein [Devosiaceae bacterium]